jgi:hypothetical protein
MRRKIFLSISIFAIISSSFIGGILIDKYFLSPESEANINQNNNTDLGYEKGWDDLKKRIVNAGVCEMVSSDRPLVSFSGQIENILDNKITVRLTPIFPLDNSELDTRIILSDSNTKILRFKSKDEKIFSEEFKKYSEGKRGFVNEDEFLLNAPKRFTEQVITVKELKSGSKIYIETEKNIRGVKEFAVRKIIVQD